MKRTEHYATLYEQSGPCWEWPSGKTAGGYGHQRSLEGGTSYVHRLAYEAFVGPIPEGHHVLHRCDNPPCCNPFHLFTGTVSDNMQDMWDKGRGRSPHAEATSCQKGHPYTPENTSVRMRSNGRRERVCLTCKREYSRAERRRTAERVRGRS